MFFFDYFNSKKRNNQTNRCKKIYTDDEPYEENTNILRLFNI